MQTFWQILLLIIIIITIILISSSSSIFISALSRTCPASTKQLIIQNLNLPDNEALFIFGVKGCDILISDSTFGVLSFESPALIDQTEATKIEIRNCICKDDRYSCIVFKNEFLRARTTQIIIDGITNSPTLAPKTSALVDFTKKVEQLELVQITNCKLTWSHPYTSNTDINQKILYSEWSFHQIKKLNISRNTVQITTPLFSPGVFICWIGTFPTQGIRQSSFYLEDNLIQIDSDTEDAQEAVSIGLLDSDGNLIVEDMTLFHVKRNRILLNGKMRNAQSGWNHVELIQARNLKGTSLVFEENEIHVADLEAMSHGNVVSLVTVSQPVTDSSHIIATRNRWTGKISSSAGSSTTAQVYCVVARFIEGASGLETFVSNNNFMQIEVASAYLSIVGTIVALQKVENLFHFEEKNNYIDAKIHATNFAAFYSIFAVAGMKNCSSFLFDNVTVHLESHESTASQAIIFLSIIAASQDIESFTVSNSHSSLRGFAPSEPTQNFLESGSLVENIGSINFINNTVYQTSWPVNVRISMFLVSFLQNVSIIKHQQQQHPEIYRQCRFLVTGNNLTFEPLLEKKNAALTEAPPRSIHLTGVVLADHIILPSSTSPPVHFEFHNNYVSLHNRDFGPVGEVFVNILSMSPGSVERLDIIATNNVLYSNNFRQVLAQRNSAVNLVLILCFKMTGCGADAGTETTTGTANESTVTFRNNYIESRGEYAASFQSSAVLNAVGRVALKNASFVNNTVISSFFEPISYSSNTVVVLADQQFVIQDFIEFKSNKVFADVSSQFNARCGSFVARVQIKAAGSENTTFLFDSENHTCRLGAANDTQLNGTGTIATVFLAFDNINSLHVVSSSSSTLTSPPAILFLFQNCVVEAEIYRSNQLSYRSDQDQIAADKYDVAEMYIAFFGSPDEGSTGNDNHHKEIVLQNNTVMARKANTMHFIMKILSVFGPTNVSKFIVESNSLIVPKGSADACGLVYIDIVGLFSSNIRFLVNNNNNNNNDIAATISHNSIQITRDTSNRTTTDPLLLGDVERITILRTSTSASPTPHLEFISSSDNNINNNNNGLHVIGFQMENNSITGDIFRSYLDTELAIIHIYQILATTTLSAGSSSSNPPLTFFNLSNNNSIIFRNLTSTANDVRMGILFLFGSAFELLLPGNSFVSSSSISPPLVFLQNNHILIDRVSAYEDVLIAIMSMITNSVFDVARISLIGNSVLISEKIESVTTLAHISGVSIVLENDREFGKEIKSLVFNDNNVSVLSSSLTLAKNLTALCHRSLRVRGVVVGGRIDFSKEEEPRYFNFELKNGTVNIDSCSGNRISFGTTTTSDSTMTMTVNITNRLVVQVVSVYWAYSVVGGDVRNNIVAVNLSTSVAVVLPVLFYFATVGYGSYLQSTTIEKNRMIIDGLSDVMSSTTTSSSNDNSPSTTQTTTVLVSFFLANLMSSSKNDGVNVNRRLIVDSNELHLLDHNTMETKADENLVSAPASSSSSVSIVELYEHHPPSIQDQHQQKVNFDTSPPSEIIIRNHHLPSVAANVAKDTSILSIGSLQTNFEFFKVKVELKNNSQQQGSSSAPLLSSISNHTSSFNLVNVRYFPQSQDQLQLEDSYFQRHRNQNYSSSIIITSPPATSSSLSTFTLIENKLQHPLMSSATSTILNLNLQPAPQTNMTSLAVVRSKWIFGCKNDWRSDQHRYFLRLSSPALSNIDDRIEYYSSSNCPDGENVYEQLLSWTKSKSISTSQASPSHSSSLNRTYSKSNSESDLTRSRNSSRSVELTENTPSISFPSPSQTNSKKTKSPTFAIPVVRTYGDQITAALETTSSAIAVLGLATADPTSVAFLNKMKIIAAACGEDEPFLPPLTFESNPTGMSLSSSSSSTIKDDSADYRGALVGSSILLLSCLVGTAILIVPCYFHIHNFFGNRKLKKMKEAANSAKQKQQASDNNNTNNKFTFAPAQQYRQKQTENSIFKNHFDAAANLKFPGIIYILLRTLLSPTVFCIGVVVALFFYNNPAETEIKQRNLFDAEDTIRKSYDQPDGLQITFLVIGIILFILVPVFGLGVAAYRFTKDEELVDREIFFKAAQKANCCPGLVEKVANLVAPRKNWDLSSENNSNRPKYFITVFKSVDRPWFIIFDVLVDIIVALSNGVAVMMPSRTSCESARYITLITCLIHFLVLIKVQPHLSKFQRFMAPLMSLTSVAMAAIALTSIYAPAALQGATDNFLIFVTVIAAISSVESAAKFLVTQYIVRYVIPEMRHHEEKKYVHHMKKIDKKEKQKLVEQEKEKEKQKKKEEELALLKKKQERINRKERRKENWQEEMEHERKKFEFPATRTGLDEDYSDLTLLQEEMLPVSPRQKIIDDYFGTDKNNNNDDDEFISPQVIGEEAQQTHTPDDNNKSNKASIKQELDALDALLGNPSSSAVIKTKKKRSRKWKEKKAEEDDGTKSAAAISAIDL